MQKCFAAIALFGVILGACPAFAQTQFDLNQAAGRSAAAADRALNLAYRALRQELNPAARARLDAVERSWISYRDADAEASADRYRGGSMAGMIDDGALERLTRDRTRELEASRVHVADHRAPCACPSVDAAIATSRSLRAADAALNGAYRDYRASLDPLGRKAFQKAQLAWLTYRDAAARFEAEGPGDVSRFAAALEALTRDRTQAIKDLAVER